MRYLLYCIFRSREHEKPEPLLGVDSQPVVLVSHNGLSAAISRTAHSDLTPDVSRILNYKSIIESFHRDRTVIPMRYGCLFEEELQVHQLLETRFKQYEALLKELEGCVEMGVRIILPECGMRNAELKPESQKPNSKFPNPNSKFQNPKSTTPGQAFMATRKAYYAQEERFSKEMDMVTQRCRGAFTGLFVKCREEYPTFNNPQSQNPFLSLYFLVPRGSVESFRQVFRHLCFKECGKLLLSGPWPPYNFVLGDLS